MMIGCALSLSLVPVTISGAGGNVTVLTDSGDFVPLPGEDYQITLTGFAGDYAVYNGQTFTVLAADHDGGARGFFIAPPVILAATAQVGARVYALEGVLALPPDWQVLGGQWKLDGAPLSGITADFIDVRARDAGGQLSYEVTIADAQGANPVALESAPVPVAGASFTYTPADDPEGTTLAASARFDERYKDAGVAQMAILDAGGAGPEIGFDDRFGSNQILEPVHSFSSAARIIQVELSFVGLANSEINLFHRYQPDRDAVWLKVRGPFVDVFRRVGGSQGAVIREVIADVASGDVIGFQDEGAGDMFRAFRNGVEFWSGTVSGLTGGAVCIGGNPQGRLLSVQNRLARISVGDS